MRDYPKIKTSVDSNSSLTREIEEKYKIIGDNFIKSDSNAEKEIGEFLVDICLYSRFIRREPKAGLNFVQWKHWHKIENESKISF